MSISNHTEGAPGPSRLGTGDSYEYGAFGNSFTVSGSTPNEMMYRGEQFDSDLGLYYLRARYYNPLTGRFMSRDPLDGQLADPKTLHKYLYAGGDPTNLQDPTGRGFIEYSWNSFKSAVTTAIEGTRVGETALCLLKFVSDALQVTSIGAYTGIPINASIAELWEDMQVCLRLAAML